jgi:hypothetical protein
MHVHGMVEVWNMFKLDLVLITVFAYTINDQMPFARVFWTLRYPFYTTEETLLIHCVFLGLNRRRDCQVKSQYR